MSKTKMPPLLSQSLPAGCGGSISSWNGSISSPYYPSYYPPNIDCTWTLEVSRLSVQYVHVLVSVCSKTVESERESVQQKDERVNHPFVILPVRIPACELFP